MVNERTSPASLSRLAEKIRDLENPFDLDKVREARDPIVDVREIHAEAYRRLERELERVRRTRASRGVLITGDAGSGKSHLIARLYRERPKDVLFFQVEALPGGRGWLKHILQCIVKDLEQPAGPDDLRTQLTILIKHFIWGVQNDAGITSVGGSDITRLNAALEVRQDEITESIADPLAHDVLAVLVNLWKWQGPSPRRKKPEHIRKKIDLASQWLKGSMIEEEELTLIGARRNLGEDDEGGLGGYLTALRVIGMLTAGRAPLILVFDQLDVMEHQSINSLGNQLLHLIGSDACAPNYLTVTAGVREEMDGFVRDRIITQAVADVIFRTTLDLPAIGLEACEQIVERRLKAAFADADRALISSRADPLFPLTRQCLRDKLRGPVKPGPRRVIKQAGSIFDEIQSVVDEQWLLQWPHVEEIESSTGTISAPSPETVRRFLESELARNVRLYAAENPSGPVDQDVLAETVRVLLKLCEPGARVLVADPPPGSYENPTSSYFWVALKSDPARCLGLVINNKGAWKSVDASLRRVQTIVNRFQLPAQFLFCRDSKAKSMLNWNVCNGRIEELRQTGRFHISSIDRSEIHALHGLDKLRRDLRDLVVPASKSHHEHQITEQDLRSFLLESNAFFGLPLLATIGELLGLAFSTECDIDHVRAFVLARLEAKKTYALKHVVADWANYMGRGSATPEDISTIESAISLLLQRHDLAVLGNGNNRILKKVP